MLWKNFLVVSDVMGVFELNGNSKSREDKFIDTINQIMKNGIENIPYQETMEILKKYAVKDFITDEAIQSSKK